MTAEIVPAAQRTERFKIFFLFGKIEIFVFFKNVFSALRRKTYYSRTYVESYEKLCRSVICGDTSAESFVSNFFKFNHCYHYSVIVFIRFTDAS